MYSCPVCDLPLFACSLNKTLSCDQGHSFDRHKKGYVNLLLVQNKKSKQPGDDSAMVNGRRAFLDEGHYSIFSDKIIELIKSTQAKVIVDAGCGEGYYLNQILSSLPHVLAFGFDISKSAIQFASRYKLAEWAVASSARMPYEFNSADLILSVFSRVESKEFSRVLKPKGFVLYAGPGPKHLMSLRNVIYPEIREYEVDKHQDYFGDGFTLVNKTQLQIPLTLNNHQQIKNLLGMTPHSQRVNKEAEARLNKLESLDDTADFRLYLYQKK